MFLNPEVMCLILKPRGDQRVLVCLILKPRGDQRVLVSDT